MQEEGPCQDIQFAPCQGTGKEACQNTVSEASYVSKCISSVRRTTVFSKTSGKSMASFAHHDILQRHRRKRDAEAKVHHQEALLG